MSRKLLLFLSLILLWNCPAVAEIYSSISGTVKEEDTQQGLNGVTVVAFKVNSQDYFQTKTDTKGKYVLSNLSPGTYKIGFKKSDYISTKPHIEVMLPRGKNVVNVNHIMEIGGSVSGTVFKADGETPMPDVKITVEVHDAPIEIVSFRGQFADDAGKFFLRGLPESDNCTVTVEMSGRGAIKKDINIIKRKITSGIDFVIRDDDITGISGTVKSASGAFPQYYVGIIVWDSSGSKQIAQANTDETGRYSIIGIPPGVYKVTAVWVGQGVFPAPGEWIDKSGVLVEKGKSTEIKFIFDNK
jgi:hypothetical protein